MNLTWYFWHNLKEADDPAWSNSMRVESAFTLDKIKAPISMSMVLTGQW